MVEDIPPEARDALGRPLPNSTRGSTAAEVAQRRFYGPTTIRESNPSVGTSSTQLLKNDPRRVFWLIINLSINQGNIGFSNAVSASNGILVAALGGAASMAVDEDGEVVSYPVFGLNANAAGSWYVLEVLRT